MDILHLIDRLEELFNDSRPFPLTNNVMVDEDRMLDLIDQMRVAIPEEVKQAQKLITERDRTLAQAQEEAKRTVSLAREKSDGLIERDAIVEAAHARAEQILDQARLDAEAQRQEADLYVLETLQALEIELERVTNQVRNGIRALNPQQPPAPQPAAPPNQEIK
ncbi:MAG: ATPase [Anaerolineae bacterium]|nr:ATPase [Anaerolineae bacterium]